MTKIHHQKLLKLLATILLATSTLTAATADEQPTQYKLESKILKSKDMPLAEAGGGIIGDDKALRELLVNADEKNEISILSSPSITALVNQKAEIRIQTEVQYFERTKDGTFALKSLPEDDSAGIRLGTTTSNAEEKDKVTVDVHLQINTLKDRKRIPGVSLDVGRPVMQTREINTKITFPVGQWTWFEIQQLEDVASGEREHLMVLLKVTPVDAD